MKALFCALLLLPCLCAAGEPIPGLGVLCPQEAGATAGEAAARDLAVKAFGAREVRLDAEGGLSLPADLRAAWWHCESWPLPPAMLAGATKQALLDYVGAGHGLFLSGTALAYVQILGLEPASPRATGSGGNDEVVAGVSPGAFAKHPVYAGFDPKKPALLVSAGFPPFSDFWSSGGPHGGNVLGAAYPNSGENPFCEFGYGKGRVIALGWRLPFYSLQGNVYRKNLEHLTSNVLGYLAAGRWWGTIPDARHWVLRERLERINAEAMRRAVKDLSDTFPDRYIRGKEYLALLDDLPGAKAALDRDEPEAADRAARLVAQLGQALLANPLLDFDRLLLLKRTEGNMGLPQNWESNSSLGPTGYDNEIAVLSPVGPEGKLTTLFRPEGGRFVGDLDLDFDASRLVFSMPAGAGRWRLWELALAGSGAGAAPAELPLINDPDVDDYDACYLPDGNLLFTSTAPFIGVPCVTGAAHVAVLYRWDRAAGHIRQLTFEQDHDWCPTVMPDGRVLYLRWEYSDLPHFVARILFTMSPDGTGQAAFYGSNSYWPNAMFYAKPVPGSESKFVAVVGGHHDLPRMGQLVLFDASSGRTEADGALQRIPGWGQKIEPIILDGLTRGAYPRYLHPWPLSDKYFLVSCKPTPSSRWGIYLVDVFDNMTLVKECDSHALLQPIPLRPRPRPPVLAPRCDPTRKDALVYMADIYQGKGLLGVPRGAVRKLRLFTYHFAYHGMGGQVNRVGLDGPWDVKRIIGTVPVDPDGSAFFRVPANTPISVQPLDDTGQALQLMRSWMTAMPGETLSCVGCHEQQAQTRGNAVRATAARRAPSEIAPWYGPTRGFAFVREVQPVLDRHCVACHHGAEGARPDFRSLPLIHPPGPDNGYQSGSLFSPSYLALKRFVRNATIESDMHLLLPAEFGADTTWLVQLLRKGHHGVQLDAESWDRIITWIDLNAPFHGTWGENVGPGAVNHLRDRRREMMARYAGRDEDPEAIFLPGPGLAAAGGAASLAAALSRPGPQAPAPEPATLLPPVIHGGDADRGHALALPDGLSLVSIPGGEFTMGDLSGFADERPLTRVTIPKAFWMARCEVTNAQFARFDPTHDSRHEEGDYLQFGEEERGYPMNGPAQPVVRVSWDEAMAYCRWLSQRTGRRVTLPTEAQWEWACRAGTQSALWFGDAKTDFAPFANLADICLKRVDTFAPWGLPSGAIYEWRPAVDTVNDGYRVTAPVGTYKPNPWGLCDMHGNAAEWTRSDYLPYPYRDRAPSPGAPKVVRGGSFYDTPERARSAFRQAYPPYRKVFDVGFRVIVEDQ